MNFINKYKKTSVSIANPIVRLQVVFDEIVKLLYLARKSLINKEYEVKFKSLTKVIDILYLLRSGMEGEEDDSEIKFIDDFYRSTIRRLEKLNINCDDPEDLTVIINAIFEISQVLKEADNGSKADNQNNII